jgi:hypothetical protein
MSDDLKILVGFALAGVICTLLGVLCATSKVENEWKKKAIQHGAAHYDSKSGEFTWNDERKAP